MWCGMFGFFSPAADPWCLDPIVRDVLTFLGICVVSVVVVLGSQF